MKLKILSKEQNPLMKRKELTFSVEHSQIGGTPTRNEVRKQLARLLRMNLELVYIKQLQTKTGTMVAIGEATAYDSSEQAKLLEPKHIIARNVTLEKPRESQTSEELAEQ